MERLKNSLPRSEIGGMYVKKRITSFLLAMAMLLSLITVVSAAQGFTLKVDKTKLAAGETVTVTVELGEKMTGVSSAAAIVHYNSDVFTYESATCASGVKVSTKTTGTGADAQRAANFFDMDASGTLEAGMFVEMTFIAKENITVDTDAAFAVSADVPVVGNAEDKSFPTDKSAETIVTVTPAPSYTGYGVTASGPSNSITVGEKANVALKISNSNESITTYNAYYMTVKYNASLLTYAGTDMAITDDKNGMLTIAGYGEDKTCGTDNIVLTFTGKAVGDATVAVESAKVDVKANAVAKDAPSATRLTAEATVNVGAYQVSLPKDFTGAGTVNPGEDYTFTADNPNYAYTFDVVVGKNGTANVTDNGNGTYTISNDQITGNLTIKETGRTGKTRNVTVEGTGKDNVTAAAIATYGKDYTFTITKTLGYTYSVNAKAGEETIVVTEGANGSYTIAGTALTGDVVITVTKSQDTTTINFVGSGAKDVDGDNPRAVNSGVAFTFKLNKQLGCTYEVKLGDEVLVSNSDDSYTIPAEKVIGETLNVTVNATKPTYTINASNYVAVSGKNIWLITATCSALTEDTVLKYGDNAMFWSSKYNNGNGAYAWLVFSEQTQDKVVADATAAISIASGSKADITTITYDGDVNMTGVIDINDAQLAWNMYSALYENFDTVKMQKFLKADMDGDGKLDTADAAKIVALIGK